MNVTHRLFIGNEDWTEALISSTVSYRADAGSSGMEFEVFGSLEDYQNAPMEFWLNNTNYFKGTLYNPKDNDKMGTATATGFGPFKVMAEQSLGTNETFIGKTLEWVIMECAVRSETIPGEIVVLNGTQYHVQQGEAFPFDNKIGDVLSTLMDKANFVGVDQPGGKRLFMPRPVAGSNSKYVRDFTPDDYMEFSLDSTEGAMYSKVIVYRNGSDGKPQIYAERDVHGMQRFRARRNSWFVVSDFAGNGQDAQDESYRLATELVNGQKKFSLTTLFDESFKLYDGFRAVKIKRGQARKYACYINDGMSVSYSPGSPAIMEISGETHEIKREREFIPITDKVYNTYSPVMGRDATTDNRITEEFIFSDDYTLGGE